LEPDELRRYPPPTSVWRVLSADNGLFILFGAALALGGAGGALVGGILLAWVGLVCVLEVIGAGVTDVAGGREHAQGQTRLPVQAGLVPGEVLPVVATKCPREGPDGREDQIRNMQ
jgi:hypothetical protein